MEISNDGVMVLCLFDDLQTPVRVAVDILKFARGFLGRSRMPGHLEGSRGHAVDPIGPALRLFHEFQSNDAAVVTAARALTSALRIIMANLPAGRRRPGQPVQAILTTMPQALQPATAPPPLPPGSMPARPALDI